MVKTSPFYTSPPAILMGESIWNIEEGVRVILLSSIISMISKSCSSRQKIQLTRATKYFKGHLEITSSAHKSAGFCSLGKLKKLISVRKAGGGLRSRFLKYSCFMSSWSDQEDNLGIKRFRILLNQGSEKSSVSVRVRQCWRYSVILYLLDQLTILLQNQALMRALLCPLFQVWNLDFVPSVN